MPDRLGDFLNNSGQPRHQLTCPKCGDVIKGSTALGVRAAMRFHRNHTCPERVTRKEAAMSVHENAQQIIAISAEMSRGAIGASTMAAEALGQSASPSLAQVQQICEESTANACSLLGEGHGSVQALNSSGGTVTEKVRELHNLVEDILSKITELDAIVLRHADVIKGAGERSLGGA